jgi:peptide deformylase
MTNRLDLAPSVLERYENKEEPERVDLFESNAPSPPQTPTTPPFAMARREEEPRRKIRRSRSPSPSPSKTSLESKEPPPPVLALPTRLIALVCYFIYACVLVFFVTSVATRVLYHGESVATAVRNVIFVGTNEKHPSQAPLYPLWTSQHNTKSALLDMTLPYARPLVAALEQTFRLTMDLSSVYPCLCMHHVQIDSSTAIPLSRVCAIYNRPSSQLYMMVNPQQIGQSVQKAAYSETSVSCKKQAPQSLRHTHVFLEWIDPKTRLVMQSKFSGSAAVCMQLALDEMEGDKHCSSL